MTTTTFDRTSEVGLADAAIRALAAAVKGQVLQPGDAEYEIARRVANGMFDRRPRLIVRCLNAADVAAAVTFARAYALPLAVHGGSHNVAGLAVYDGGLVIDLSAMRERRVDPPRRAARVDGGAAWADVDHVGQAYGFLALGR